MARLADSEKTIWALRARVTELEEQNERLTREVSEHAAAVQHASDLQDEAEAERDRLKEQLETLRQERDDERRRAINAETRLIALQRGKL